MAVLCTSKSRQHVSRSRCPRYGSIVHRKFIYRTLRHPPLLQYVYVYPNLMGVFLKNTKGSVFANQDPTFSP